MQSKLSYIKSKLRDNEELALGVLSILCFYTIVISSLANGTLYFSVFFEEGEYWPSLIWKVGLLIVSILTFISCYKSNILVFASSLAHVGVLYYYNLFSLLSFNAINYCRIIIFSSWWLSVLFFLRYSYLVSQKNKAQEYFFANVVIVEFCFILMCINIVGGK